MLISDTSGVPGVFDDLYEGRGIRATIGGELHQFCCQSCETQFTDKYDELQQGAD